VRTDFSPQISASSRGSRAASRYGMRHSILGKELRGEISAHGISPAGMLGGDDK